MRSDPNLRGENVDDRTFDTSKLCGHCGVPIAHGHPRCGVCGTALGEVPPLCGGEGEGSSPSGEIPPPPVGEDQPWWPASVLLVASCSWLWLLVSFLGAAEIGTAWLWLVLLVVASAFSAVQGELTAPIRAAAGVYLAFFVLLLAAGECDWLRVSLRPFLVERAAPAILLILAPLLTMGRRPPWNGTVWAPPVSASFWLGTFACTVRWPDSLGSWGVALLVMLALELAWWRAGREGIVADNTGWRVAYGLSSGLGPILALLLM